MSRYAYEINPRPAGGWCLRLLEDDQEVGGGAFPPVGGHQDETEALDVAYSDAQEVAEEWLNSRPKDDQDEQPAFLDEDGPSDALPNHARTASIDDIFGAREEGKTPP